MHKAKDPVAGHRQAAFLDVQTGAAFLTPQENPAAPQDCAGAFAEAAVIRDVLAFVTSHPGCSQRMVERALSQHRRDEVRAALRQACTSGLLTRTPGRGRGGSNLQVIP